MGVNGPDRAPAVRRAVSVLDLITQVGEVTSTDVSRDLMIARSSTSDLITAMLDDGLIRRRDDRLTLGSVWERCAAGFVGGRPVLEHFVSEWDRAKLLNAHTVSVQALLGDQTICLDVRMGRHVLAVTPRPGSRFPVWNGVSGEPILSRLSPQLIENSLAAFSNFCGASRETVQEIIAFARAHTSINDAIAPVDKASTGNYEMTVAVPGAVDETVPTALTLHLAPDFRVATDVVELSDALHEFASKLST